MALGHLGDVHEAFDTIAQLDERAKGNEFGDLALDDRAYRILLHELLPRILGGLLQAKRDALTIVIHVKDHDLDIIADAHDLGRVIHVTPRELRDMHQSVDSAQVHECTKVHDAGYRTLEDRAFLESIENRRALFFAAFLEYHSAGKHDVVAVAIHLDNARLERLTHERCEILDAPEIYEGGRQEATKADIEDQSTLDDLYDLTVDDLAVVELLFDVVPCALVLGTLL